jgi:hypothetical protein
MIGLLLYFLFGSFVIRYEKPVHFAAGFAGVSVLLNMLIDGSFVESILSGLILFAYTAFVYMIVDRYGDRILAPIGVLVAGAAIMVGAAYYA